MTPQEARLAFKVILNRIDSNMNNTRRDAVKVDLEVLLGQIPVSSKTLEVRNAINDTIIDLASDNILEIIERISARTSAVAQDTAKLAAATAQADKVAKGLSLESATELVNLVRDGLGIIAEVKGALETDDRLKLSDSVESALEFFLMLKFRAEAKMLEFKNT
jgi:hypothetical protein